MTSPAPGAPNWVDLATSDLDGAKQFYSRLFGWTNHVSDGYMTFLLNGLPVAGAGPLTAESQPTAWSTYLATDSADAVAFRVTEAGGKVLVPPFDVLDQGRLAAFLDPAGAPFSVWQAGTVGGAAVFDTPGALTWNELNTRDVEGSAIFYASVFGWTFRETTMDGSPYVVADLNGTAIAGLQPMIGDGWGDLASHWMVYFAVPDCDRAASAVAALGGTVLQKPRSIPIGQYAIVADPSGAVFSLLAGSSN
jgi:predicted enzyme related to lactoylglutathione lyase